MSQQRQNKMVVTNNGDTTYTKIFVGGLAWETQRDTLKRHFEQFGEILEAVVIIEKNTGRSRGYGFVTFKDPDSAKRACQNHYPVIDGRRANCNLAAFGARSKYPTTPRRGMEKSVSSFRTMASAPFHGTPTYFQHHIPQPQYGFPYSTYGCPDYPQDIFTMNYYNVYGGQHLPSSYCFMPSGPPEIYDYPRITQHPYFLSQQYRAHGDLQVPTLASPTNSTATAATASIAAAGVPGTASDQQNLSE